MAAPASPRGPRIPIVWQPPGEGCVLWKVGCTGLAAGRVRKGQVRRDTRKGPLLSWARITHQPPRDLRRRPATPWELAVWNRGFQLGSEELEHALAPAMLMLLHSAPPPSGPPLCLTVAGTG